MDIEDLIKFSKQFGYNAKRFNNSAVTLDHPLKHVQKYHLKRSTNNPDYYSVYLATGAETNSDDDWSRRSFNQLKGDKDYFRFMIYIEVAYLTRAGR